MYIYIHLHIHIYMENGNGKQKFVFLGRQTINGNQGLLFQQTCTTMQLL
jgi:hypothetical protein